MFRGWRLFWILRKKCNKTMLQKPDPFGSVTSLALPTEHDAKLEGQVKNIGYPSAALSNPFATRHMWRMDV